MFSYPNCGNKKIPEKVSQGQRVETVHQDLLLKVLRHCFFFRNTEHVIQYLNQRFEEQKKSEEKTNKNFLSKHAENLGKV